MKKIFYLAIIAGFTMASCAKTENHNPNEGKTYSFSIGAEKKTGNTDETRVEMIDGLMHWSVGDQVGMFVYGEANQQRLDIAMTGVHTQPKRATTFTAELTENQLRDITHYTGRPDLKYLYHTYVSYYPYNLYDNKKPKIEMGLLYHQDIHGNYSTTMHHTLPHYITVHKNEFPSDNVIMVAIARNVPPMTWLDDNGQQEWGERITLTYKHTLAYLRIKIGNNPTGRSWNSFQLNSIYHYSQSGTTNDNVIYLAGPMVYYSYYNTYSPSYTNSVPDAKTRLNITVPEGVSSGDYFYVPIPPARYEYPQKAGLEFRYGDNFAAMPCMSDLGITQFEAGKIYDITFNLP